MVEPDLPDSEQAEGKWAVLTAAIHVDSNCGSPADFGGSLPWDWHPKSDSESVSQDSIKALLLPSSKTPRGPAAGYVTTVCSQFAHGHHIEWVMGRQCLVWDGDTFACQGRHFHAGQ